MPTLTLTTASIDTNIEVAAPNNNYGSDNSLILRTWTFDYRRISIKFNLASLPDNAIITSAILSLYLYNITIETVNLTAYVYRQKRAWVENQVTWNIYSTGNNWATAGGFGSDDCEQAAIGSKAFTAPTTNSEYKNFVLTPTTKAGLDLGNGWLIKFYPETTHVQYSFYSSNNASNKPKLVINYSLPSGGAIFNPTFSAPFRGAFE